MKDAEGSGSEVWRETVSVDYSKVFSQPIPARKPVEAGDDQLSVCGFKALPFGFVEIGGLEARVELVDHRQSAGVSGSDQITD